MNTSISISFARVLSLVREGASKIAHGYQRVGMLGSERQLPRCKQLELLRLQSFQLLQGLSCDPPSVSSFHCHPFQDPREGLSGHFVPHSTAVHETSFVER